MNAGILPEGLWETLSYLDILFALNALYQCNLCLLEQKRFCDFDIMLTDDYSDRDPHPVLPLHRR